MDITTFRALAGKNRYALFASACLIPATCIQPAFAAEQQPEEVIVTGSRIRQSPVEQTAPVQTSTAADIDRSGEVSVADYLQRLPISGSAINRANNASGNLGFPPDGGGIGAGASEIDLRYLTSKRVLVLVDGRRWVRGSSASGVSGAVDLNTIPTAAIERIEVLQDGASPIYGSDAIAGVVNVITKSDFDGFEFETNQAAYDEGDGYTQDYNLSWGTRGDKSHTFLSLGYSRQDPVMSGDRELSECVVFGATPCNFGGSGGVPQGRFVIVDPRFDGPDAGTAPDVLDLTLNNGATGANYNPANPASGDYHTFTGADRFNFRPFNYLATPNRRVNVFGKAAYDVADNVQLTFTGSFTNRQSHNQAAPNPLFLGSDAGAGFYLDNAFIPADQRYNPFGIDLGPGAITDANGQPANNLITIGRRPVEAGPRIFDQNVDSWMLSGALSGDLQLGNRNHFWDVSLNWGRNNASQTGHNIFQARKLALALGPEDECLAVPGCVPFNIFGGEGTITPDMLAWATYTQNDTSKQELNDIAFNLSGDVFDLPAGAFAYAFGLEYRKETGEFNPDSVAQAGETADVPASPTAGEVKVKEAYLELRAPLLADLPAIQRLELSGAVRSSDYDTFGRDEVYKLGLYWRVFNDLSVRANYAEGFRAPNIGELFNTGSRFDSALDDPCSQFQTLNPGAAANCTTLGVPTSYQQFNSQISVQTGGNESLTPETSDTYTIGLGYSPSWAKNASWIEELTFDVNYYNIKLDNAIQALDAQVQLDNCVASLSPLFCDGIVRAAGGSIVAFANQLTNIGRIETDGFDWTFTLSTPEFSFGALRFTWANTYLAGYKEFTLGEDGLVGRELAGIELGSPTRGYVRYKSTLATDWQVSDFVTSLTLRYLSAIDGACTANARAQNLCSDPAQGIDTLDSRVYADLQVAWTPTLWDQRVQLALGINNVLDEDPPPCRACDLNNYDGTIYPVPGRYVHARAAIKF
jgi:iron complex outermembrane receptor protein